MGNPMLQQVLGGRFRLESLLGQGGMGAVYAATDLSINRLVAIKLLRREMADDAVGLERLREEAVSLAALRHPNVVQLYDFYAATPDTTFLLMELVDGENLARRLDRDGPLPVTVAVDYARQVLSALSAAHGKGIIHRDIKPGNVLVVTVPMQKDLVKVLDFGIAKLTEETIRRRPTTAGMLLGTPSFMSPEQAGGRPIDARSDIYAAALLLYTMLAGRNPFSGLGDIAATLVRVQSVMPPPIDQIRRDVPSALAEVVAIAMAKSAEQRFQTAVELVQAIDWASASPGAQASSAPAAAAAVSVPAPATVTQRTPEEPTRTAPGGPGPATREHSAAVSLDRSGTYSAPRRPMSTGRVIVVVAVATFATVLVASVGFVSFMALRFVTILGEFAHTADAAPPPPIRQTRPPPQRNQQTNPPPVAPPSVGGW